MKQISELVENNLNLYAPLICAEPFKFKIEITENDFQVIVDRGHARVSDIRRLSGAESSCFNLLLLLAILPLIPNARRVDTIILDEMDAPFGEPLKELYTQKFLPMLQTIVPKVVVITTSKTLKFAEATNYLIVKEGEESRIEELGELTGLL
jgi:DNA repair exonuclease SbcCD ATPase subunit